MNYELCLRTAVIIAVVLAACSPPAPRPDADPSHCGAAGRSVACACSDGRTGAQVCGASGVFGPCVCGAPGADAALDATMDAADDRPPIGMDAPLDAPDAREAGVPPDASPDGSAPFVWDGTLPRSGVCSIDGWCWRNPVPGIVPLHGVWGSRATDVWAVGGGTTEGGAILHWDGTQWTGITGLPFVVTSVRGSGANDVWITSGSDLLHWAGARWTRTPSGSTATLGALSVRATNDAWVVGSGGTILRWDGTRWAPVTTGVMFNPSEVFARAADDVWVTGDERTVLQWDGTRWNDRTAGLPTLYTPGRVWSAARDNAFMVVRGMAPTTTGIYRWNGAAWSISRFPSLSGEFFRFVTGVSPTDVYAGGYARGGARWDGARWIGAEAPSCPASDAWAAGPDDYFVVSTHFPHPGGSWDESCSVARIRRAGSTRYQTYPFGALVPRAIYPVGRNDIIVENSDGTYHRGDGRTFRTMPIPPGRLHVFPGGEIWAYGSAVVARWDGTAWVRTIPTTPARLTGGTIPTPRTLSAHRPDDVWMAGGAEAAHWNGTTWTTTPAVPAMLAAGSIAAIWGMGPNDLWISNGAWGPTHFDGRAWSRASVATISGDFLWGASPSAIYLLAGGGLARFWDGTEWRVIATTSSSPMAIYEYWAQSGTVAWAAAGVYAYQFDGRDVRPSRLGLTPLEGGGITRIAGTASDDIWVVGNNRVVMHRGP